MFPEFYDSGYAQSANIPYTSSPFNAASLTISFWLNIAIVDLVQPATIVQYGDPSSSAGAGSRVNITWNSADLMVFDVGGGDAVTAGGTCSSGSFDCLVNSWHQWTFTYNYSAGLSTKASGWTASSWASAPPATPSTCSSPRPCCWAISA